MKITYAEETDYGQEVLQLVGEISSLMDTDHEYTKREIMVALRKIKNWSYSLERRVVSTPFDDPYFTGAVQ